MCTLFNQTDWFSTTILHVHKIMTLWGNILVESDEIKAIISN